jgi:hypothetical protein
MMKLLHIALLSLLTFSAVFAQKIDIDAPPGSTAFGTKIIDLANGNYVISDPSFSEGELTAVGAVYLYNGRNHNLISAIKGSHTYDRIGLDLVALPNSNFLIKSESWNNSTGALTWASGSTGISGVVDNSNSLTGGRENDIQILPNGNLIVSNRSWNQSRGAVTFVVAETGITGAISGLNSFTGSYSGDEVGMEVTILPNNRYVIRSNWQSFRGAITLASGNTGIVGIITASNSLIGSQENDYIGSGGITALPNGNLLVSSPSWQDTDHHGAVTWINSANGTNGEISTANSLIRKRSSERAPFFESMILTNGNYAVYSHDLTDASGAVTWGNGSTGVFGVISAANSFVGPFRRYQSSDFAITPLKNGNYVMMCSGCLDGRGSVTFANGNAGIIGTPSESNSLVGEQQGDFVGIGGVVELANSNFVISSYRWNSERGAATWGSGITGITGKITGQNSLIGSKTKDAISFRDGSSGILPLANGNYVVSSVLWNNHTGSVTWANGALGITGEVNATNSLLGAYEWDRIGQEGIVELSNGNFVVSSGNYNTSQGAVTWVNGEIGITGPVNGQNSLLGGSGLNNFGDWGVTPLKNGNYLVSSSYGEKGSLLWRNGLVSSTGMVNPVEALRGSNFGDRIGSPANSGVIALDNGNYVTLAVNWNGYRGAATWGNGTIGTSGVVNETNSLVGAEVSDRVGSYGITVLNNGNYLVQSPSFNILMGAVTWGSSTQGVSGVISNANSLVGTHVGDRVGYNILLMPDGNYILRNFDWTSSIAAITLGNGSRNITGEVSACNSLLGDQQIQANSISVCYNAALKYLIVGRPQENGVSIFKQDYVDLPVSTSESSAVVNGTDKFTFISNSDCKIIASVQPDANTIAGLITTKVWLEPSIPVFRGNPFVARHYEVNAATASGIVTLYFKQSEFDDFNAHDGSVFNLPVGPDDSAGKANLKISQFSGTSSDGSGLPASLSPNEVLVDPDDSDIVWNNEMVRWEVSFHVNGFSNFLVHSSISPLPVTLVRFKGEIRENTAQLSWQTTDELNTESFQVERSSDAKDFRILGEIKSNNTSGLNNYFFNDSTVSILNVDKAYYRLKMLDQDNSYAYSKIIDLAIENAFQFTIHPNPTQNSVAIKFNLPMGSLCDITVVNAAGALIHQEQTRINSTNSLALNTSAYPAGLYLVTLRAGQFQYVSKFVKE